MRNFLLFLLFIFFSTPSTTWAESITMSLDSTGETFYEYELSEKDLQDREKRKTVLRKTLEAIQKPLEEARVLREAGDIDKALEIMSGPVEEIEQKLSEVMDGNDYSFTMDEEERELMERHGEIADEIKEMVAEQAQKNTDDLIEKWGESFIRESLYKVHVNLMLAVFMSDYYIACLEKDRKWLVKVVGEVYYDNPFFEEERGAFEGEDGLYSETMCAGQIHILRDDIRERYSLMRLYLIAASYPMLESDYTRISEEKINPFHEEKLSIRGQIKRDWANDHYKQNKHFLYHRFPRLVTPPPISRRELILASRIFDKNRQAMEIVNETGRLPKEIRKDPEVVCARPSPTLIVDEFRNCFMEKYKELLVGNQEERKPGLGILGYITSPEPTDEELVKGIREIRKNAVTLLENFQRRHFFRDETGRYLLKEVEEITSVALDPMGESFIESRSYARSVPLPGTVRPVVIEKDFSFHANVDLFQFLAGRLETDSEGYGEMLEAGASQEDIDTLLELGKTIYQENVSSRMWTEIGIIVGWSVGACPVLTRGAGLILKGVCELPVGLLGNAYFLVVDTKNYHEAMRYAFYRPDGARPSYQEMSELEGLTMAYIASTVMAPFFTGVPQIAKGLRQRHLDLIKNSGPKLGNDTAKTSVLGYGDNIIKNSNNQRFQIGDRHVSWMSVVVRKLKRFWKFFFSDGVKGNPYVDNSS